MGAGQRLSKKWSAISFQCLNHNKNNIWYLLLPYGKLSGPYQYQYHRLLYGKKAMFSTHLLRLEIN